MFALVLVLFLPMSWTAQAATPQVEAGIFHTVALKTDGTVWTWGANYYGQLGTGTTTRYNAIPAQVPGLTAVAEVAAGGYHTVVLKDDGTVLTWGDNVYGQLGNGTSTSYSTIPSQIPGLSGVAAIAAGTIYNVALKDDGTVWGWGQEYSTGIDSSIPVEVPGLSGVATIGAGNDHIVALKADGTVWAWGSNRNGQLGDGTTLSRATPAQVPGLTGVTAIATGNDTSMALKDDGTVWAWGANDYGQLGDGTTTDRLTPVQVTDLSGVAAIDAEFRHTVALKSDGTVWTWGSNSYGQLGDGTKTDRLTPVQISGLSEAAAVTTGRYYTVALKYDGTVWAWGANDYGQLGDGTTSYRTTPIQITGLTGVAEIDGGGSYTIVLKHDGTVWSWGVNDYGQLGDGTLSTRYTPFQVAGLSGVTEIAAGYKHSVALKDDGTVWTWGSNNEGQLGDGTMTDRNIPGQVPGLSGVAGVAAGWYTTIALKEDGTIWAWGSNHFGQLGDGNITARSTAPVQVSGLSGVTEIAAGAGHTVALKEDGTVWAWGRNKDGEICDSTSSNSHPDPGQVLGLSGMVAVSTKEFFTLARKDDGTVWACGDNSFGQLGDGTETNRNTPVQASGLSGVVGIAAGAYHSAALKDNGTVWNWGHNRYGQLGDGTLTNRTIPDQVSNLSGVAKIATGRTHNMVLKHDGTVWGWGPGAALGLEPAWTPRQALINLVNLPTHIVTPGVSGAGEIAPNLPQWVGEGEVISFTVSPSDGHHLEWVSGCGGVLVGDVYTTAPITEDCTVTASFAWGVHALNITINGSGIPTGSVSFYTSSQEVDWWCMPRKFETTGTCTGYYQDGEIVSLHALCGPECSFTGWTGDCAGTDNICVLTMDAEKNVTATFVENSQDPVILEGSQGGFTTIQQAYDSIPLGQFGIIKVKKGDQARADLMFDRNVTLRLIGGYDEIFNNIDGDTSFSGSLTIRDGSVTISDIFIK